LQRWVFLLTYRRFQATFGYEFYGRDRMIVFMTVSFLLLSPLCTFGLLFLKGLPAFAAGHTFEVLVWVYQVTWMPALSSGLLLAGVLIAIRPWLPFFIRPYDIGRSFSLGAVTGALAEALSTWGYRTLSHRPFSSFWIAGAMIAGFLTGAGLTATLFARLAKRPVKITRQLSR
jgi:hypothetical protein